MRCSACGVEKERDEFTTGLRKDGSASMCKPCMREYAKKWRAEHKESELARYERYRKENAEKVRAAARERMRKKRAENAAQVAEYERQYRKDNPEKVAQWHAKKRAARYGAKAGDTVTAKEWRDIKRRYSNHCVYCLKPFARLQMDHVVALSKGGRHIAYNIVPACAPCNNSKHANDAVDWVQKKHGRLF